MSYFTNIVLLTYWLSFYFVLARLKASLDNSWINQGWGHATGYEPNRFLDCGTSQRKLLFESVCGSNYKPCFTYLGVLIYCWQEVAATSPYSHSNEFCCCCWRRRSLKVISLRSQEPSRQINKQIVSNCKSLQSSTCVLSRSTVLLHLFWVFGFQSTVQRLF